MADKFLQLVVNDALDPGTAEVHDYAGLILGIGKLKDLIEVMHRKDAYQLVLHPDLYDYLSKWLGHWYLQRDNNIVRLEAEFGSAR